MGKHGKRAARGSKVKAPKAKVKAAVKAAKGIPKKSISKQMVAPKHVSVDESPLQRTNQALGIPDITVNDEIDLNEEYIDEDDFQEVLDEEEEEEEEDYEDFF